MISLLQHITDVRNFLNTMAEDWKIKDEAKRCEMLKYKKLTKLVTKFSMATVAGGTTGYTIYRVNAMYQSYSNELVTNSSEQRLMYGNSEFFFFETQTSPRYEIIAICQFISTVILSVIHAFTDGFFITLIFHLCGQIENFNLDIKNMVSMAEKNGFDRTIALIVQRHLQLKRYNNFELKNRTYSIK